MLYYARPRGVPVVLPTAFDAAMTAAARDWWHFAAPDSANYALSNEPL